MALPALASVRGRLMLLLALALGLALAVSAADADAQRKAAVVDVHEDTARLARLAALAEQRTLEASRQVLASVAWAADLRAEDPELCHRILADANASAPQLLGLAILEPDGTITCSSRPMPPGWNVAGSISFRKAMAARTFVVGEYAVHRLTGEPTVGIMLPVLGPDGAVLYLVGGTVDLAYLSREIARADLPPGYVLSIWDRNGTVLVRLPDHARWVGQRLPGDLAARLADGGTVEDPGLDGLRRVFGAARLSSDPGAEVVLSVGAPLDLALAPVAAAFEARLAQLALAGGAIFAAAWVLSDRWIAAPLRRIGAAARRLAAGDLAARAGPAGDGELGTLAADFDAMAASLQRALESERAARADLEAANVRLERLDRFRTEFVSMAAHELNNPLTPVVVQAHLLRSGHAGPLTPAQRHALDVLDRNLDRLQQLVQDVLDAARLQAGRLALDPRPVELATLVAQGCEAYQAPAQLAGVALEVDPGPPGLRVHGDPGRLAQVLDNLLSNALKYTPRGGAVRVGASAQGAAAVVEVRDTGPGFDAGDADRLFQPFQRLEEARAAGPGSGLGLHVARGIAEQHGGTLRAASAGPGLGATFQLRLPRLPADVDFALEAPQPAPREARRAAMPPAGRAGQDPEQG